MTTETLTKPVIKSFDAPDDALTFDKARINVIKVEDKAFTRLSLEPGFTCTSLLKPEEKESGYCEAPHLGYLISGKIHLKMKDGSEYDINAGSIVDIPGGHEGWVEGNSPAVILDLKGEAPAL